MAEIASESNNQTTISEASTATQHHLAHPDGEETNGDREHRFDDLSGMQVWAYGMGHYLNDLVAACWFNYLFFYLKSVVQTPAASVAMLSGQVMDGLATPIVGFLSDRTKTRFGQRTPWYVFGVVLVAVCYLPIYQSFRSDSRNAEYAYYILFPSIFNLGWASLQISHMSLVPSLTCSRRRRDRLNNLRNTFTFLSNFVVLALGLIIFATMTDPQLEYSLISYCVLAMGLTTSIFFLYHVREVPLTKACADRAEQLKKQIEKEKKIAISPGEMEFADDNVDGCEKVESIKDWFKMRQFYLFGICYLGVRLYANMFGTLVPFFLIAVLDLGTHDATSTSIPFTVALVPLIVYLASVVASSRINWFYGRFGRKIALLVGSTISLICIPPMYLLTKQIGWVMYILSVGVGISQTLVLATGINFISDVVGAKTKTGAFVFGVYSLLDKFSTGVLIYILGNTEAYSKSPSQLSHFDKHFISLTVILIPVLSSVLATGIVLAHPVKQYKKQKKQNSATSKVSIEDQLVF